MRRIIIIPFSLVKSCRIFHSISDQMKVKCNDLIAVLYFHYTRENASYWQQIRLAIQISNTLIKLQRPTFFKMLEIGQHMFIFIIAPFSNLIKLNRLDTVPKCRWLKTLSFLGLKMVKMGSKICIFNKVSFFESDQTESIEPSNKMQLKKNIFHLFFWLEMVGVENVYFKVSVFFFKSS